MKEEGDLRNKALISATYVETPPPSSHLQRHWAWSGPSWLRWCSISSGEIKPLPLSGSSQQPGSPRQRPALSQSACLCNTSAVKQAPEKINASDNWPIILLWLLLPLALISSVNISWQLYILATGVMACPICWMEGWNLSLWCLK